MKKDILHLLAAMLRTGVLGYGGGPATVPLLKHEAVNRYAWISNEEFAEMLAIANTLPGPIATKLAAALGYRQKGAIGAVLAVLAHILPTGFAMVGLFSLIHFFQSSPIVHGMIAAVVPVIAVMFGQMTYEFGEKALRGLGLPIGIACFLIAFVLLQLVTVHPAFVILLFLAYGAVHFRLLRRKQSPQA